MDSQQNVLKPSNQMPKAVAWVVIIVIVLILGVGGYFLLKKGSSNTNNANAGSNSNQSTNINGTANANAASNLNTNSSTNNNSNNNTTQNTNSVTNSNSASNTNTTVDTTGWKTYDNATYHYSFKYPDNWRTAEDYMRAFAAIRHPDSKNVVDDYVVVTSLTSKQESDFVTYANAYIGIGARPWYEFGLGETIIFTPSTATLADYEKPIPPGGDTVTLTPSNIHNVTLKSGYAITRLQRYESNDNGSFTYQIALFPVTNRDYKFLDVRIAVKDNSFQSDIFDNLLETIRLQ